MTENKKILLYRIDEQAKNVIFIITEDVENTWKEINENMQTVLSFDEIFRNITEFRNGFLNYEQSKNELIKVINCSRVEFVERMEWFDEDKLNSFNFFTRYYSNTLKDIFLSARQELVKVTAAFRNDKLLKKLRRISTRNLTIFVRLCVMIGTSNLILKMNCKYSNSVLIKSLSEKRIVMICIR